MGIKEVQISTYSSFEQRRRQDLACQWNCAGENVDNILFRLIYLRGIEARQPNSAIRKCISVRLIHSGKTVTAFVPYDGGLNFIEQNVNRAFFLV